MNEEWNKEFAFYAAALYRIGNYTDAALVGSIMFEKAIKKIFEKKNLDYPDTYSALSDAITELGNKYPDEYNKNKLHNIRDNIRNKIIHKINIYEINPDIIKEMINITWKILDQNRYQKYDRDPKKIDFLIADYHVIWIREYFNKRWGNDKKFERLEISDFKELNILREKMFSLSSKIENEVLNGEYKNIKIDLISRVDTTSAYVWIPMHIYGEKGEKLTSVSASILATPLDFRIYLDIGGGTHRERKDYYKYLLSDNFQKIINSNTLKNLEYFDIDWYCFIVDQNYVDNYSRDKIKAKIIEAKNKLDKYKDKIITWNKLLVGFVIERDTLTFDDIRKKLEFILSLYKDFKDFQNKLNRK